MPAAKVESTSIELLTAVLARQLAEEILDVGRQTFEASARLNTSKGICLVKLTVAFSPPKTDVV